MTSSLLGFIFLGLCTGVLSGFFGVGGGVILVPALIWIFGFSQLQAQGMSLAALVLPVGILGVLGYYKKNPFPIPTILWIALGIFLGTWIGTKMAHQVSAKTLKVSFGILMVVAGIKMIFGK